MLRMGLGTGHLASSSSDNADLLSDRDADNRCCSAARRKLKLSASAEGHDLAKRIRRTARLEALFKNRVKDDTRVSLGSEGISAVLPNVVVAGVDEAALL
jgi:hypothetical protein